MCAPHSQIALYYTMLEVLLLLLHMFLVVYSCNGAAIPITPVTITVPYRIVSSIASVSRFVTYYPWNDGKGIMHIMNQM